MGKGDAGRPFLFLVAREGALDNRSPALCAGFRSATGCAAAEAAATKFRAAKACCSGRLRSDETRPLQPRPVYIDTKFAVKMVSTYTGQRQPSFGSGSKGA